jgi:hypothetical protein
MNIEIGLTENEVNTQFAPLAVVLARYQTRNVFETLEKVPVLMKIRDYSPADKLKQVLISVLAGCETLSESTSKLESENVLAELCGWSRFSDQSNLSRFLDSLSLKQIDDLRQSTRAIWWSNSQVRYHSWHAYLWLDYDLSGLPCSANAQESQKGYFSDKKTPLDAN